MRPGLARPSALAPFASDWVGGNIHGLSALAGTLDGYLPKIDDVVGALDAKVGQIVGAAGWQGSAATAFTQAWGQDALAIGALGTVAAAAGAIINQLAVNLAKIENALERAADAAEQAGVGVGPDGLPLPPSVCAQDAAQQRAAAEFDAFRAECLATARAARATAAGELLALVEEMMPGKGRAWGQGVSAADALRSLWAYPTVYRGSLEAELTKLESAVAADRAQIFAEQSANRDALGRFGPASDEAKGAYAATRDELAGVQDAVADAASHENMFTRAMGYSLSDAGLDADGTLGRFFDDIPLLGIGAAALGTGATIDQDRAEGEPWWQSVGDGVTSNAAALAAGEYAGAEGGAVGGVVGGAVGQLPGAMVGGAVGYTATGGLAAVGVGDLVHNMWQENWPKDVDQYGVVGGAKHGAVDVLDHTRHDLAHTADDIGSGVHKLWDGFELWDEIG